MQKKAFLCFVAAISISSLPMRAHSMPLTDLFSQVLETLQGGPLEVAVQDAFGSAIESLWRPMRVMLFSMNSIAESSIVFDDEDGNIADRDT